MRLIALVVALYVIWRVAVAMGQGRDRARRSLLRFGSAADLVRCRRCGRIADAGEMTARGIGPWRGWVCRPACRAGDAEEHADVV